MDLKSNLPNWFRKHWMTFTKRPENGETAMRKIDDHLKNIKKERERVSNVAEIIISDANDAKDLIKENNVIAHYND